MTRSAKRREHDRRKAVRLAARAQELGFAGAGPIRCNCENLECEGTHDPGVCLRPGSVALRIEHLGTVCPACFLAYPEEYRVNRFDGKTYSHRY